MQNTFTVTPMSQRINLKAGEIYHGTITVANPAAATEDFSFQVAVYPYSVSEDYSPDFQTMSNWSRIVEWIELEATSGTLAPNETKKINFTVEVPENAPAGGQYAMIGISSSGETNGEGGGSVQSVYEMASLLFADVEGETYRAGEIKENSVQGFVAEGLPTAKVVLVNDGNVHEVATTTIKVKNVMTGEIIRLTDDEESSYEALVMPDTTREVTRELEGLPALGIFEVTQDVSYLDQSSNTTATMVICPIWFMALVIGLIASIIGMICYGAHLRHKKVRKVLETGNS